jgi:hypothetical protein
VGLAADAVAGAADEEVEVGATVSLQDVVERRFDAPASTIAA